MKNFIATEQYQTGEYREKVFSDISYADSVIHP